MLKKNTRKNWVKEEILEHEKTSKKIHRLLIIDIFLMFLFIVAVIIFWCDLFPNRCETVGSSVKEYIPDVVYKRILFKEGIDVEKWFSIDGESVVGYVLRNLKAGAGINIFEQDENYVVENTGVLSVNGQRGGVVLSEGGAVDIKVRGVNIIEVRVEQSGVLPGSYGSDTKVPVFNVDEYGRITEVKEVDISGLGGDSLWKRDGVRLRPINSGDDVFLSAGEFLGVGFDPSSFSGAVAAFSGNVGIGTVSPTQELHIAGDIRVTGAYYDSSNSSGVVGYVLSSTGSGTQWVDVSSLPGVGDHDWYRVGTNMGANNIADDIYTQGRVGIGFDSSGAPLAPLHIIGNSAIPDGMLISEGTIGSGATLPISGFGTKMFWYPRQAAFRAGFVNADQWDDSNIGSFSVAFGSNTVASNVVSAAFGLDTVSRGIGSVVFGMRNVAAGDVSAAFGIGNFANGQGSIAFGQNSRADGTYSVAGGFSSWADGFASLTLGYNSRSAGQFSTAIGERNFASGRSSFALGVTNISSGTASLAVGFSTFSSGLGSFAAGFYTSANSYAMTAVGANNVPVPASTTTWVPTDPIFVVGNGENNISTSNALTILKNGNIGIRDIDPQTLLVIGDDAGINNLSGGDDVYIQNDLEIDGVIYGGFNQGSVLFSGSSGEITEDNANFYWDDVNKRLGVGTNTPEFALTVRSDGGIAAGGTFGSGPLLTASMGSGPRMFWYPRKAAFRAGYVSFALWSDSLVGAYSAAFGYDSYASGDYSFAAGGFPWALGEGSVSLGFQPRALGNGAIAIGRRVEATADGSIAMGFLSRAQASGSVAIGQNAYVPASGLWAFALGYSARAEGNSSLAMGSSALALGDGSIALGGRTGGSNSVSIFGDSQGYNSLSIFGLTSPSAGNSVAIGHYSTANFLYTYLFGYNLNSGVNNRFVTVLGNANEVINGSGVFWDPNDPVLIVGNGDGFPGLPYPDRSNAMVILKNGNVGLGSNTPSYRLQVGNNGDGTSAIANAWNTFSDARWKEDIKTIEDALDKVLNLEGVSYKWKNSGRKTIGFIAQEVESILPELVSKDRNGYYALDYSKFTPVLVEALKEQNQIVMDNRVKINKIGDLVSFLEESSGNEYVYEGEVYTVGRMIERIFEEKYQEVVEKINSILARIDTIELRLSRLESSQQSGSLIVSPGAKKIEIRFEKEFSKEPIVFLSFNKNVNYTISNIARSSFVIEFEGVLSEALRINWIASVSKDSSYEILDQGDSNNSSTDEGSEDVDSSQNDEAGYDNSSDQQSSDSGQGSDSSDPDKNSSSAFDTSSDVSPTPTLAPAPESDDGTVLENGAEDADENNNDFEVQEDVSEADNST